MQLSGRWRIIEMDDWDRDAIDLLEPAYIEFETDHIGYLGFIAIRGQLDCRVSERDGQPCVEFSWAGDSEGDPISGRGWAVLVDDATLEGHVFIHMSDDSRFRAVPFD